MSGTYCGQSGGGVASFVPSLDGRARPRSRASVVVIAGRSALAGALAFAALASGHDAVVASP